MVQRPRKQLFIAVGSLAVLSALTGSMALAPSGNSAQAVPDLKSSSVWVGVFHQPGNEPYPIILFVSRRTGNAFQGTTWYPTPYRPDEPLGMISVSGSVEENGVVTFTEEKVLYGEAISGGEFTASLDEKTLKGEYQITLRGSVEKGEFQLKLAQWDFPG